MPMFREPTMGKVSAALDELNRAQRTAGPCDPGRVLGCDSATPAGERTAVGGRRLATAVRRGVQIAEY
jgi:hypothetical protein